jgi:hypothetical protein
MKQEHVPRDNSQKRGLSKRAGEPGANLIFVLGLESGAQAVVAAQRVFSKILNGKLGLTVVAQSIIVVLAVLGVGLLASKFILAPSPGNRAGADVVGALWC